MEKTFTNRSYLDLISRKVVLFDGAMGTSLQKMDLTPEQFGGERTAGCNDYLVISYPKAVETVHRSFLEVGADAIETCTFRSNGITLAEYGLSSRVLEINREAAILAKKTASEFSTPESPRLVAGSIGPSGKLPSMNDPELSNVTFSELADVFREQARGLLEGGVDLLLIETSQDILEVKAAIRGIHQAFEETGIIVPIQAQVTLDTTGRMLLGTDIAAVQAILEGMGIDVIGLNCSTGPDFMREPIRYLGAQSTLPVSCIPNAGLPMNVDGQAVYPMLPEPFARELLEFVTEFKINVVGGCCGTTPDHIRLLANLLKEVPQNPRPGNRVPMLASAVEAVPMQQEPAPFLIGERLNTQGSARFKKQMLVEDYESSLDLARSQLEDGAHGLDVCVALTERTDEADMMRRLVKLLSPSVRAPFVIDTTEPDVLESALQAAPGRCLINSTNLESGRKKLDKVFSLAKAYNAAVICLTIDEQGMAKTAARKLEIAHRIYDIAVNEFNLKPGDLVFDDLTFTMATGDPEYADSAIQTMEGIRLIKSELPGVLTSLGVSNVSFGLKPAARAVLNSVMLYHCVQAGLDMAIINPAHITPYAEIAPQERDLAENLLFNRDPDALQKLIERFENFTLTTQGKGANLQQEIAAMLPAERLHYCILHRLKEPVEASIDEIIFAVPASRKHDIAITILNETLLPAMKEVGDKFGSGYLILPFVLQSAEVMKKSVSHLEKYLEKKEGTSKGTMVLATVYGDVHDIGKNLVKTILSNNGYDVVDLGKQVPAETIITKAVEHQATAIGLSALLVSTSRQMPLIVNELQRRNLGFPVLIGGAAINPRFGRRILQTEEGTFYEPGVFYCKDAFEGLSVMDSLTSVEKKPALYEKMLREAEYELNQVQKNDGVVTSKETRSTVARAEFIPKPPHWGPKLVKSMPLDAVFQHLAINELYRLSWGAKNTHGAAWKKLKAEYDTRLDAMRRDALNDPWLFPQGMYGYWPAQSTLNELIIYDPESYLEGSLREVTRLSFPRQEAEEHLSLSDYFSPVESGVIDVVALQVVTVGLKATEIFDQLQSQNRYTEAYFTHGLAVQMAEATADYLHQHIRREMGLQPEQGKRYSWGYPAIPELSDHRKVFYLLPVEAELGMQLSPAYQLIPEQSTAAIIVHHPAAKYFNIGESRIDQLTRL
jgi:5-methyltetrahydrofolate--homocysteine methyltransferase